MVWTDRFFASPTSQKQGQQDRWLLSDYVSATPEARQKLLELQQLTDAQSALVVAVAAVSFAVGFQTGRFRNPWRRFTAVLDIPSNHFGDTSPFLRGRVVSVSDGDTIRFRHTPNIFQSSTLNKGEQISAVALPIRICTIDTPETSKFGKPGQPFGEEAKQHLSSLVENRIVQCQLLQKDQYGRAVAQVRVGPWPFYSFVDEKMLQAGLAEVYTGSGAVYGRKGKESYLAMMEKAKGLKKGIWSQAHRESAADYKARLKDNS